MNESLLCHGITLWEALPAAVGGYLAGSIPFARIVHYLVTGSWKFTPFREKVPGSEVFFDSDLVSATTVSKNLGARYGCLVSLLDMAKVALPTLALRLWFPGQPLYLITAIFGMAGHIWPLWFGCRGGRGESPLMGALLVIDWAGLLLVNGAATLLGFLTGSVLVIRWGGYVLLVFWFWLFRDDPAESVFMVLACILYFVSMRKDLLKYRELKRQKGSRFTEEEVSRFIMMGGHLGRILDRFSLYALFRKWRNAR
jgi:glycerol-3-phosphate acyltransferase PlsY